MTAGTSARWRSNAIFLSDDEQTVAAKVRGMFTDPNRIHADTPGTVEGNPVFIYHRIFNADRAEIENLEQRYTAGKVGDKEVKEKLAAALNNFLGPFRRRMAFYQSKPGIVDEIIWNGTLKMQRIAKETMREVREKMGLDHVWKSLH